MITILYFAGLKELTGKSEEQVAFTNKTVKELLEWAQKKYVGLSDSAVQIAVNEEYVLAEDMIHSGDQVAFIPPVSGG